VIIKEETLLSSLEFRFVGRADDDFNRALRKHLRLHQGVGLSDLLKFLYQSSLGPFHLLEMMSEKELLGWIRRHLEKTKPSEGLLVEPLYGKKWVRLNFGPYKTKYGNDYQRIYEAFMQAKNQKPGRLEDFEALLKKLVDAFRKGSIQPVARAPEALSLVTIFLREYREKHCPPIHHSKSYMLKNSSDYLVVPSAVEL
jgi:hypothetical protein